MSRQSILDHLHRHEGRTVSGAELSRRLKISRAAVWKDVQALRRLGYDIQARTRSGYRLLSAPDRLLADEIARGLDTRFVGRRLYCYDTLDSTNDTAFRLGEQGVPEGACVIAEYQRKGRGRLGRVWESPKAENLLLSVLLRPRLAPAEVAKVTLAMAVSVVKTVEELAGQNVQIKWPNDVLWKGRKLCGILMEMSAESDRVNFVVAGLGVNLNTGPGALPPGSTSLAEITGSRVHRVSFVRALLRRIEKDYLRLGEGGLEELGRDWEEHSATTGHRIRAILQGRTVEGQAMGIDTDGALWIRSDNGLQERILTGDVLLDAGAVRSAASPAKRRSRK